MSPGGGPGGKTSTLWPHKGVCKSEGVRGALGVLLVTLLPCPSVASAWVECVWVVVGHLCRGWSKDDVTDWRWLLVVYFRSLSATGWLSVLVFQVMPAALHALTGFFCLLLCCSLLLMRWLLVLMAGASCVVGLDCIRFPALLLQSWLRSVLLPLLLLLWSVIVVDCSVLDRLRF